MGQQQLLLLVLGIVIVGLAVVVGIRAFSENSEQSERDAVLNDMARLASDAKAWVTKPVAMGGGGGDANLVNFESMGYDVVEGQFGDLYENVNGYYYIAGGFDGSVYLEGCGKGLSGQEIARYEADGSVTYIGPDGLPLCLPA